MKLTLALVALGAGTLTLLGLAWSGSRLVVRGVSSRPVGRGANSRGADGTAAGVRGAVGTPLLAILGLVAVAVLALRGEVAGAALVAVVAAVHIGVARWRSSRRRPVRR